jgi:chorismate mutase
VNVRAARGAIVVPADDPESMRTATSKLLDALLASNAIAHDDLISILFTATDDLSSAFPAEAARRMGMGDIPLLCAREIPVVGSMPSVVRILMHFHTELGLREVTHVYLDGAERLRDDIDGGS